MCIDYSVYTNDSGKQPNPNFTPPPSVKTGILQGYLLVEVIEREISVPEIYDTHAAAHDRMCELIAEVTGSPIPDIKESYLEGVEFDDRTCVLESCAWTERHGVNYDWKIFRIDDHWNIA